MQGWEGGFSLLEIAGCHSTSSRRSNTDLLAEPFAFFAEKICGKKRERKGAAGRTSLWRKPILVVVRSYDGVSKARHVRGENISKTTAERKK